MRRTRRAQPSSLSPVTDARQRLTDLASDDLDCCSESLSSLRSRRLAADETNDLVRFGYAGRAAVCLCVDELTSNVSDRAPRDAG
jgi:hypothetical protein